MPDIALAQRIVAAYARAPIVKDAGPVWDGLLQDRQDDLAHWLGTADVAAFAQDIANLGRSKAAQGFFGGEQQHERCRSEPGFGDFWAASTYDKLLSLAEAIGIERLELPENGSWAMSNRQEASALFTAIERKMGLDLRIPDHVGGYLGISVGETVIQIRAIEAIYAAFRLKQLAVEHDIETICEIGAGAGLTAYYALLLGIKHYIIIDLPTMNAVQAYVLGGSRIGIGMTLVGDEPTGRGITILPTTGLAELSPGSIGLLYNQDSFPEIEPRAARAYLKDAARLKIPRILSINQEAHLATGDGRQESVAELIADTGGFSLSSRHRHWLRQGYVEELYRLN